MKASFQWPRGRAGWAALFISFVSLSLVTCTVRTEQEEIRGRDLQMTIFHTSDIHSRLYPYYLVPGPNDQRLGLRGCGTGERCMGGAARVATLLKKARAESDRFLYVDSGDVFQGAPVFSVWREVELYLDPLKNILYRERRSGTHRISQGEPEFRVMSELGVSAMVVGNHEFDSGAPNLAAMIEKYTRFPLLAANYQFEDPSYPANNNLRHLVHPFTIINVRGLRVGLIGIGDVETMRSIKEGGNSLGITPLDTYEITQDYVDLLQGEVDLICVISHIGFRSDQDVIHNVQGIDMVFGGHLHIALQSPKVIIDPAGREVLLVHSGAFTKFAGRLDVVVREAARDGKDPKWGWEVAAHKYELTPLNSDIPEDGEIKALLEPYTLAMKQSIDLDRIVAYAEDKIERYASGGGDSGLGNIVAEALQYRNQVETDFSITNSTGIRTDLEEGPVALEQLYNIFPFDNTITTMFLSGREVQELFNYIAHRTSSRGCSVQAQISGATVVINCDDELAYDITIGGSGEPCDISFDSEDNVFKDSCEPESTGEICTATGTCRAILDCDATYELATNDYIAGGGSGYEILERNTTQHDTGISMRSAVEDYLEDREVTPACLDSVVEEYDLPGWARCIPSEDPPVGISDGRTTTKYIAWGSTWDVEDPEENWPKEYHGYYGLRCGERD